MKILKRITKTYLILDRNEVIFVSCPKNKKGTNLKVSCSPHGNLGSQEVKK